MRRTCGATRSLGRGWRTSWQWNHVPDDTQWSLTERPGWLRLHSLAAKDLWTARNTLTQRAHRSAVVGDDGARRGGMRDGDVAGLGLLNRPFGWIGVHRSTTGLTLQQYDQRTDSTITTPLHGPRVWLRADADFLTEQARFSYSTDGAHWTALGAPFTMVFQLVTFQGVRFALFHYNTRDTPGGVADFDRMERTRAAPARADACHSDRKHDRASGRRTRHAVRGGARAGASRS